jgi:hypothetical protein
MPRTSRDHFTAQTPKVSRSLKNKGKHRLSKAHVEEKVEETTEAGLHDSRSRAETEEMTRATAASPQGTSPASAAATEATAAPGSTAGGEGVKPMLRPPLAEELAGGQSAKAVSHAPALVAPAVDAARTRGLFQVLEDGRGELEAMSRSMIELGGASLRLVQLSFELAWLTARSIFLARW